MAGLPKKERGSSYVLTVAGGVMPLRLADRAVRCNLAACTPPLIFSVGTAFIFCLFRSLSCHECAAARG